MAPDRGPLQADSDLLATVQVPWQRGREGMPFLCSAEPGKAVVGLWAGRFEAGARESVRWLGGGRFGGFELVVSGENV